MTDSQPDVTDANAVTSARTLYLYTDFVCPFCYIAEHSTVPRLVAEHDLTLEWHGFELHPGTPKGGLPLTTLFRGVDLPSLHQRTQAFAETFGITNFRPPDWLYNTRRALAAAELARDEGKLDAFRKAAFEACFRQHRNLEDDDVLVSLAEAAHLPKDAVLRAADEPSYVERIDQRQREARQAGVTGIPTFVLGDRRAVGCQPYERLEAALGLAG